MSAPSHFRSRRQRYAKRAHDVESRRPAVDDGRVVWYRGPEGDHAFGVTADYLRSKCHDVRWNVRMQRVEGTVHACTDCMAMVAPAVDRRLVAPPTESELHAMDGNR